MAKFKKGQKVMKYGKGCYYIDGKVVEFVTREGWGRDSGWDSDSEIPDDYTSIGNNTYHYANDKELELITDYQPILPKVGERYRVLKTTPTSKIEVGDVFNCLEVGTKGYAAKFNRPFGWLTLERNTTEYLELVEEETTINRHVDVLKEYFETLDTGVKPMGTPYRLHDLELRQKMYEEWVKPELKKTKQTTMQKLTSALKRVLSADKQTLYKAGVIGSDLELTTRGQSNYTDALFNNEGDHKKAVAEMVAMAQAELDEAKA